jgi:hypothetical protein
MEAVILPFELDDLVAIGTELFKKYNLATLNEVVDRVCARMALRLIDVATQHNLVPKIRVSGLREGQQYRVENLNISLKELLNGISLIIPTIMSSSLMTGLLPGSPCWQQYRVFATHTSGIVIAVPTASASSARRVAEEVDQLVCLNIRSSTRFAVAEAYEHWYDLDDQEVMKELASIQK